MKGIHLSTNMIVIIIAAVIVLVVVLGAIMGALPMFWTVSTNCEVKNGYCDTSCSSEYVPLEDKDCPSGICCVPMFQQSVDISYNTVEIDDDTSGLIIRGGGNV